MEDLEATRIMAKAVLLPIDLDLNASARKSTPLERQQHLLAGLEKRRHQVRQNIIALSTACAPSNVVPNKRPSEAATAQDQERLAHVLASRPAPNVPPYLKPGTPLPQPTTTITSFPGTDRLIRTQNLLAEYDRHVKKAKEDIIRQTSTAPRAPARAAMTPPPHSARPTSQAQRSAVPPLKPDRRDTAPPTAQMTAPPASLDPVTARPVTADSSEGGRRQSVEPGMVSRRLSMGDVRSQAAVERVEGFFRPGQAAPARGGSMVDRSRDPRQRRGGGS